MTRKQLLRALASLMYLSSTGDLAGFEWMLSRRTKRRLRGAALGVLPDWMENVLLPEMTYTVFGPCPLYQSLSRRGPIYPIYMDGGSRIQEPLEWTV